MSRVVLKLGGRVAADAAQRANRLRDDGHEVVVVHGAGPQITSEMERLGIEPRFVDGRRVTTPDVLDVVRDSLAQVNAAVCAAIGPHARVCCYETGDEVHASFAHLGPSMRRGNRADLEAVTRALLTQSGVRSVHAVGACTICSHVELFWSYRREGTLASRQGGIVWRS